MSEETIGVLSDVPSEEASAPEPDHEAPAETPISEQPVSVPDHRQDVGPDGLEVLTEHEDAEPDTETAVRVDPPSNLQELEKVIVSPLSPEVMKLTPETVNRDVLDALLQKAEDAPAPSDYDYAKLPDCRDAKIGDWAYEARFVGLPKASVKAHLVIDGEMRVFERVGQSDAWERKA